MEKMDFELITGNDAQVLPALQAGASGGIIAVASVFPELAVSIWNHFKDDNIEAARESQKKVLRIRELFRTVMPTIAHKEALKLQGFDMGPSRFPFRDLTGEERERLKKGLEDLGIIKEV